MKFKTAKSLLYFTLACVTAVHAGLAVSGQAYSGMIYFLPFVNGIILGVGVGSLRTLKSSIDLIQDQRVTISVLEKTNEKLWETLDNLQQELATLLTEHGIDPDTFEKTVRESGDV